MKLSCKRIDFTYTPGEEIFTFPDDSGLPFIFDVEEELTGDPAAMDAVGKMLDEAEKLAEKAKAATAELNFPQGKTAYNRYRRLASRIPPRIHQHGNKRCQRNLYCIIMLFCSFFSEFSNRLSP